MKLYFLCSYELFRKGFYLTRMEGEQLVSADGEGKEAPPDCIRNFFSYDRFKILWRDYCDDEKESLVLPSPEYSMLGVRNLEGTMSGRKAYVNLALLAEREEFDALRDIALEILGDFDSFSQRIFQCLKVGGECGYDLNSEEMRIWRKQCREGSVKVCVPEEDPAGNLLRMLQDRERKQKTQRDLLHFAVCTTEWKAAIPSMGPKWVWLLQPRRVLDEEQFREMFTGRGSLVQRCFEMEE